MMPNKNNFSDWELIVSRNLSFLHQWLSVEGHIKYAKLFGCRLPIVHLSLHQGMQASLFVSKVRLNDLVNEYRRIFKSGKNRKLIVGLYEKYGDLLKTAALNLSKQNYPNKTSFKLITNYFDAYRIYTAGLNITSGAGKYLTEDIYQQFNQEMVGRDGIGELISILTFTDNPTPTQQEEVALLKLRIESVKWSEVVIKKAIKNHSDRYGCLPANFVGHEWGYSYFYNQFYGMSPQQAKIKLDNILKQRQNLSIKRDKLYKDLKLSDKLKDLTQALRTVTDMNEYRKYIFSYASVLARPYFNALAKKSGLKNWRDLHYLSVPEIKQLIVGKNSKKIIINCERRKHYLVGLIYSGKVMREMSGNELSLAEENLLKPLISPRLETKSVVGVVGQPGRVIGTAKIVLTEADFKKVGPKDIIIAKLTSMDYITIMKKALGFITNEGGITSHPAIIAREMGKPCIVGTKIATNVFKDGDIILLDATKGLARKV